MDSSTRDHLANERTFLAYVRTSLAFVGFGFVIARFALFIREFAALQPAATKSVPETSVAFGVVMVLLGIGIAVFGAVRYVSERSALLAGRAKTLSPAAAIVIVAVLAAFAGLVAYDLLHLAPAHG